MPPMASSMAIENASSSCFPSSFLTSTPGSTYKYEVFISFRGSDTRKKFTSHLYKALKWNGISTYRDDENLERGEFIATELLRAIKESRFAVIIFSKDYASSSWCLTELVEIVECMDKKKLIVLPVFHDVNPSDVRKLRGTFEDAFTKHLKDNIEDVQTWKAAMTKVAGISGWDLRNESESTVIEKIIQRINYELDREVPSVSEHLVGMESRVEQMLDLYLGKMLDCVRFIGICGMGGIGKTTLAREIYNRIFRDFEASSFIDNVREESESHRLVSLQKQLLCKILKGTKKNISNVYEGINVIRKRLRNKKVLIVLDDVNEEGQLKALAGKDDWFGVGSIIIVTSRDSHLLNRHWNGVKDIYIAKGLNDDEALELFSWNAFKEPQPEESYVELSKNFVKYADGLPLALEVLGSLLFRKRTDEWKSALEKLKVEPDDKIFNILKISFDGLTKMQQELFLDIAFFFKGEYKDGIIDVVQSFGFCPNYNIGVLVDRSLITIREDESLWMHDLLQEMGQDIVRRESPKELGRRSRLCCYKDVLHVLKNNIGTEFVEGIVLNTPAVKGNIVYCNLSAEAFSKMKNLRLLKIGGCNLSAEAFSKMKNLRLLKIGGLIQLPQGLNYLSSELRTIDWLGYPLKSMPTSFQPSKLVELRMHFSGIKQLWKGIMILNNLKLLDLSGSQNLIVFPDLSGALNLKQLILQHCIGLYKIHASLGDLKQLIRLDLNGCNNISRLPDVICSLMSLKTLNLSGCTKLDKLPENIGNVESLEELYMSETAVRGLPSSVVLLKNLKKLFFSGCDFLLSKPSNNFLNFPLLQRRSPEPMGMLLRTLSGLSSLTDLNLSYCNLGAVPDVIGCLSSLRYLNLRGNNLVCLPKNIIRLSKLDILNLSGCPDLRLLPELPLNIKYIEAEGCTSLETLPLRPEADFRPHLHLINCVKLIDNQGYGDMFSTMLARYIQRPDLGYQNFIIPGSEIPKWFSHQSEGTSLNMHGTSNFMGIAVCVVFVLRPHVPLHQPIVSELYSATHWLDLYCNVNGSEIPDDLGIGFSEQYGKINSYHLWIKYFPFKGKRDRELSQIAIRIRAMGPGLEVTKWGARMVYEQDIEDLKQNMSGSSSRTISPLEDDLDDPAKETKIRRSRDDSDRVGTGPSGELEVPHPKRIQLPNLIEKFIPHLVNWIGNSSTQEEGDSGCEEE